MVDFVVGLLNFQLGQDCIEQRLRDGNLARASDVCDMEPRTGLPRYSVQLDRSPPRNIRLRFSRSANSAMTVRKTISRMPARRIRPLADMILSIRRCALWRASALWAWIVVGSVLWATPGYCQYRVSAEIGIGNYVDVMGVGVGSTERMTSMPSGLQTPNAIPPNS